MKKVISAALLLPLFIFLILISSCDKSEQQKIDSLSVVVEELNKKLYDPQLCDTVGLSSYLDKTAPAKPKKLKSWAKAKVYTLCIEIDLKVGAQAAIITIDKPGTKRVELVRVVAGTGKLQVKYTNVNGNFTPEIAIKIIDRAGNELDLDVTDTTKSVCGPGTTTKDKVLSTDTQGSTVYVTIDEK